MESDNAGRTEAVPQEDGTFVEKCCCFDTPPHLDHEVVYVLVFEGDIVKIGRTGDPRTRIAQHLTVCSLPLIEHHLFAVYDSEYAEERLLHWYGNYKINDGEWFVIHEEDRKELRQEGTRIRVGDAFLWPYCARMPECQLCHAIWAL